MSDFDAQNWARAFAATSVSFSVTINGANSNRAACLSLGQLLNTAISFSASVGGVAGALIANTDTTTARTFRGQMWGVTAPPGGSQTATMSWTGAIEAELGCAVFYNADQTTPFNGGHFSSGTTGVLTDTPTAGAGSDISHGQGLTSGGLNNGTGTLVSGPAADTTLSWETRRGSAGTARAWDNAFSTWLVTTCNVLTSGAGPAALTPWAHRFSRIAGQGVS